MFWQPEPLKTYRTAPARRRQQIITSRGAERSVVARQKLLSEVDRESLDNEEPSYVPSRSIFADAETQKRPSIFRICSEESGGPTGSLAVVSWQYPRRATNLRPWKSLQIQKYSPLSLLSWPQLQKQAIVVRISLLKRQLQFQRTMLRIKPSL